MLIVARDDDYISGFFAEHFLNKICAFINFFIPLRRIFFPCVEAFDALQVLGAQGYMKDHPLERHYRDARQLMIVEGSSQIQRVVISRAMLDRNLVYG